MIPLRILLILALTLALALGGVMLADMAAAQSATEAARQEGKTFGRDTAGAAQSAATTGPDAERLPNFDSAPPQSGYFENPGAMDGAAATQSTAHDGYQAMRSSTATRAHFDAQQLTDTVARGKAVAADPNQFASGMGGITGHCVPLPAAIRSPGRYTATCNTGFTVDPSARTCHVTLDTQVTTRTDTLYLCNPSPENITNGVDDCALFETAACHHSGQRPGRCLQYGIDGSGRRYCTEPGEPISEVTCSEVVPGGSIVSQTPVTSVTTSRNESDCASLAAETACTIPQELCTDSDPVTRIINGQTVTAPCWAWDRTYQCNAMTAAQDCGALEANPTCTLLREDCLTEETPCLTTERVYDCALPPEPVGAPQYICDGDIYCINGECETIVREANTEFRDAVVALNAIKQARGEFDPDTLSLFKGERGTCSSKVFGVLNCCKGKGFPLVPGISLLVALGCDAQEVLLHQRDAQGLCTYVGTYCSSKVLGVCTTKRKTYCCYESKLTRIIQEQGRPQLGKVWASPKTEQCAGFTLEEFSRLDLSQMDFSEVYAEFTDAVRVPDELATLTDIQQKIEDFYAQTPH